MGNRKNPNIIYRRIVDFSKAIVRCVNSCKSPTTGHRESSADTTSNLSRRGGYNRVVANHFVLLIGGKYTTFSFIVWQFVRRTIEALGAVFAPSHGRQ